MGRGKRGWAPLPGKGGGGQPPAAAAGVVRRVVESRSAGWVLFTHHPRRGRWPRIPFSYDEREFSPTKFSGSSLHNHSECSTSTGLTFKPCRWASLTIVAA